MWPTRSGPGTTCCSRTDSPCRHCGERDPEASLGITLNFTPAIPASDAPEDVDVARRVDGTANRFFIEPITTGHYPSDVENDLAELARGLVQDGDLAAISAPIDVLGVNYYTTNVFRSGEAGPGHRRTSPHRTRCRCCATCR